MIRDIFEHLPTGFKWIDLSEPTQADFDLISTKYNLHPTSVQDCLDPEHLPKFERIGDITFIIVRAYDETCSHESDSIQDLTRKIALFASPGFLITVHRREIPFLSMIFEKWKTQNHKKSQFLPPIVADILKGAALTYKKPIENATLRLDDYETTILKTGDAPLILQDLYYIKRKAYVFKRVLHLLLDIVPQLDFLIKNHAPFVQDLKENSERVFFYANDLFENANNLLYLQVSLASHRTNEVMRLLTVFSAFFMPLTFIVGIYGMNFQFMPELQHPYGYAMIWALMIALSLTIFIWFKRKGLL